MNKAIETFYRGINFRSKNEAKWALFFDLAEIEWKYEPQVFWGFNNTAYKPDFYFPKYEVYAEVKSSKDQLHEENMALKLRNAIDWESTDVSKGLILLGAFPYDVRIVEGLYLETDFLFWHKGVVSGTVRFLEAPWDDSIQIELNYKIKDCGDPIPGSASPVIKCEQQRYDSSRHISDLVRQVNEYKF